MIRGMIGFDDERFMAGLHEHVDPPIIEALQLHALIKDFDAEIMGGGVLVHAAPVEI